MLLALGLIGLGLLLLILGGESLLRGAVGIATLVRLTPAVIGLTVVAAGTSIPELAVSSVASLQGKPDITVGNVVGSNIFNLAFILGIGALLRPLAIHGNTIRLEYPVLALVTLMCLAICYDESINRLDASLFLSVYVGFTAYMVSLVRGQMSEEEQKEFKEEAEELGSKPSRPPSWLKSLLLVVVGVALLSVGAHATVTGASEIGKLYGLSDRVIGLTIVGAGTGLPELVTSIVSSIRGRDDVAIGNVIGSNLFNILVILGLPALIHPLPIDRAVIDSDNWWMLGVTLLLFPLMALGMRITRFRGLVLMAVYIAYLTSLVMKSMG